jgi:F-type H+-transporting ATPase subunit delta
MAAIASRYAGALADVVFEQKLDVTEAGRQLEDFAALFNSSKDLREALLDPVLSATKRVAILDAFNRQLSLGAKIRNFLAVLIEHGRLGALNEILEQYRKEVDRRLGISEAEVVTARQLEASERADLERQVAELAGTAVRAQYREEASLIGGVIVRIGSTVYDGSVRGRLERLRDRLIAG